MKEKKYVKISMGTAICLVIIFILSIGAVGLGIYMYVTNEIKDKSDFTVQNEDSSNSTIDTNVNNVVDTNKNETVSSTNKTQQLDINSELIKNLYNYIVKYNSYQELTVYQTKKVTKEDINNQLKLITVFKNLKEDEAKETKNIEDEYGAKYKHIYYSKETVESKAREIFGENVQIKHENCDFEFCIAIDYNNGVYDKYEYQGGGGTPWERSKNNMIKAEQTGDTIVIYDAYAHVYSPEDSRESGNRGIYTASDRKKKITDNDNIDNISTDKFQTFKHTFQKVKNSNKYYWISTEPVNQ